MAIQWELLFFSLFVALGMGSFAFVSVADIYGKLESVRLPGVITALGFLGLGGLASFLHLGHPERIFHMLGNMRSGISQEFISTAIAGGILVVYAALLLKKDSSETTRRNVAKIGILAAVLVVLSTGKIYLQGARPAWDTVLIPLLYLASAGPLGMFMMLTWSVSRIGDNSLLKRLGGITMTTQVVFAAMVLFYVIYLGFAPFPDATRSPARLLSGDLASAFWGLVVVIGLIVPMLITHFKISSGTKPVSAVFPFVGLVCTLIGAGAIRALMYLLGSSVHQYIVG